MGTQTASYRQGFRVGFRSETAPVTIRMHDSGMPDARWRLAVKALGYAWAAPTTIACVVLFLLPMLALGQARPAAWRAGAWEWTVTTRSCFWRWYARDGGWGATTLGWCILFATSGDLLRLAVHERRHVVQNLVLGPLFMPLYALLWLAYGYERHPLERDARAAAGEFLPRV